HGTAYLLRRSRHWLLLFIGLVLTIWFLALAVIMRDYGPLFGLPSGLMLLLVSLLFLVVARNRDSMFARIRKALDEGSMQWLAAYDQSHPGESLYAFAFEVNSEALFVTATAATELSLDRLTQTCIEEGYRSGEIDTVVALRKTLRWRQHEPPDPGPD